MGNPLMPNAPSGLPGIPQSGPKPEEIDAAHGNLKTLFEDLLALANKPQGDLTKSDVLKAGADYMPRIKDPQQRDQFVKGLIGLPEDEGQLRQAIGSQILQTSQLRSHLVKRYGPPGGQGA